MRNSGQLAVDLMTDGALWNRLEKCLLELEAGPTGQRGGRTRQVIVREARAVALELKNRGFQGKLW